MADSSVQLNNGTGAKKLDTEALTIGADVVERQRAEIAGSGALEIARVINTTPGASDYALAVRNIPSGTQAVSGAVTVTGSVTVSDGSGPLTVDGTVSVGNTVAVTGPATDAQLRATPLPVSGTVTANGTFWQVTQPVSGTVAATGPLTNTELRAVAVPVSGTVTATGPLTDVQLRATPVPVSGTVTASGPLTDTQMRASAVPVSGPLTDAQLRAATVPVSGTVTASGPVTDTQLRAIPLPVSGTVTASQGGAPWSVTAAQATAASFNATVVAPSGGALALDATLTGGTTKAISRGGAKGATTAADITSTAEGTDHQAGDVQLYHGGAAINPQTIRALTSADVVTAAQGAANVTPWNENVAQWIGSAAPTVGQKAMTASLPVALASDQTAVPITLGTSTGKSVVMKTGAATTTATTADQVVVTYTVTTGKTFYLTYLKWQARLTTYATTATNFGAISLELPSGTKVITEEIFNAGIDGCYTTTFAEPPFVAAGAVIRVVCTPSASTSFRWAASFGGYEK